MAGHVLLFTQEERVGRGEPRDGRPPGLQASGAEFSFHQGIA